MSRRWSRYRRLSVPAIQFLLALRALLPAQWFPQNAASPWARPTYQDDCAPPAPPLPLQHPLSPGYPQVARTAFAVEQAGIQRRQRNMLESFDIAQSLT